MPVLRATVKATMLALLPVFACHVAWADISMPSDLGDAFGELSTGTSTADIASNVAALEAKVAELKAQASAGHTELSRLSASSDGYDELKARVAQMEAASSALQKIIVQLKSGRTISSYDISTDAADLTTTVTIKMADPSGSADDVTVTESIPPSTTDTAGSGGGADILTQMLQQLGLQGGGNPLANIQSTLNNLVQGNAPLDAAALCSPDGKAGNGVAVYDISAGKVYMPNGEVLEAHSGMGAMMDNPAYVNQRMNGPTPPNTYNLTMRESLFYGVEAIRMTPTDPGRMYGRTGMLAHSKLVRGNNGSHGCVAFANYPQFLAAFKRGEVKQLVVVANSSDAQKTCKPPQVNTPDPISQNTPSS